MSILGFFLESNVNSLFKPCLKMAAKDPFVYLSIF